MYCSRCGTENPSTNRHCTSCGQALHPPRDDLADSRVMRAILPVGRSALAIAAGYAGLFALLIFPAPLALILGVLALRDLKRRPEKYGKGRAVFGLLLGVLGTVVLVVVLVAVFLPS